MILLLKNMDIDIAHIAKLANLPLTQEELDKYGKQLPIILDFVNKINKVNTENIEPTLCMSPLVNVMREDNNGS